jgi:outer membrane protein assembly factor BamB
MRRLFVLAGCIALLVVLSGVRAGDWPQFRGPGGSGLAADEKLPIEWNAEKNIAWKAKVAGYGWSSPIVWGDKVIVTTAITDNQAKPSAGPGGGMGRPGGGGQPKGDDGKSKGGGAQGKGGGQPGGRGPGGYGGSQRPPDKVFRWEVVCLDRNTGKELWKSLAIESKPRIPTQPSNTYASETPLTDGERIYAYFGMTGLFCFDLNGKQLWKQDLGSYPMLMGWGTGSSPALADGRLFVQCDNEENSFLAAFDAKTGNELWREKRDERTTWATPYIWKNKQRTELVTAGTKKVRSYDPATGKLLWELGNVGGQCNTSPVGDDERLFVGNGGRGMSGPPGAGGGPGGGGPPGGGPPGGGGQPGGGRPGGGIGGGSSATLFAIKAGASGNITLKEADTSNAGVDWTAPRSAPAMASAILYQGYLYTLEQRGGQISCIDAKTGKAAYSRERIGPARGFTSSPVAADGKIYCLDDSGQTFVIQAGPEFKLLSQNPLNEMCWSSPAVSGGAVYLRTVDHLYCIKQ